MSIDISASKIPENLSRLRKSFRYTQKELAKMAGLDPNYYAKALNISITDIVGF